MKEKIEEEEILMYIQSLANDFFNTYHIKPSYIKAPLWVRRALRVYANKVVANFNPSKEVKNGEEFKLFGMKLLGTVSIDKVENIEVF